MKKTLVINNVETEIEIHSIDDDLLEFSLDGKDYLFSLKRKKSRKVVLEHKLNNIVVLKDEGKYSVKGHNFNISNKRLKRSQNTEVKDNDLVSPMPGKILKVNFKEGDKIKSGDIILVMEAMKMEHSIRSPRDGKILSINAKAGELVDGGIELCEIGE